MAIPLPLAELICHEHRYRSLPVRILLLGRQTICFNASAMYALASRWGLACGDVGVTRAERDTLTIHARQHPDEEFVTDTVFFQMLGVREIDAIDHSDFEGANIILDICGDLPLDLIGRYDFIFNGSVLDNVWDPPSALRNVTRLLSDHGRVIHVETASACRYNYTALSPSWYFDYYVWNGFADVRVYLAAVPDIGGATKGNWPVIAYDPSAQDRPNAFTPGLGDQLGIAVVVAEKRPGATADRCPIQAYYRSDKDWEEFLRRAEPVRRSTRPLLLGTDGTGEALAAHDRAWRSCGHWG